MAERAQAPALDVKGLNVFYGASHALQGVDLHLAGGVLSVVGRNGMGKTTLCKAIMGLVPAAAGSITFAGQSLIGKSPAEIARLGVGYVPQGRRLWRSLTVDEHLRLVATKSGAWTVERIYSTFPRLAERKSNGGAQLSGGEQQMLAISRALLSNPKLLIMDEPTEGLAPVIVEQVEQMLIRLAEDGDIDVLVIEQNIGVATAIAEDVAIMVNGRINRLVDAGLLASDRDLQQRLLGVGRHGEGDGPGEGEAAPQDSPEAAAPSPTTVTKIYLSNPKTPTRWSRPVPVDVLETQARIKTTGPAVQGSQPVIQPITPSVENIVLVAGTFDTKGAELRFMRDILRASGLPVRTVDLSTTNVHSGADVPAHQIAAFHPRGASGVFTNDRGQSVAGMTLAFERWMRGQSGILGILSAGGSGGTAIVAPAMRSLPVGVPKIIVSTVASGEVSQYVGAADITMMHSVADVQGINAITRSVLGNAANAMAGMANARRKAGPAPTEARAAIGLTMFGVTTPAVQQITAAMQDDYDCLVFHATGIGGQSMEKLVDSGMIKGVIDATTTEVCDMMMGGVFAATEDRFGAMIRARMPYVGAVGALDMVNFGAPNTVPEKYRGRLFYEHNPQVTLMRTTPEENTAMGRWIGERLNQMEAPVRFFLTEGGVSLLDAPGKPFDDPRARAALFDALEQTVRQTPARRLIRLPHNINAPEASAAMVAAFRELHGPVRPHSKTKVAR
ncbi:ABC transporter permease [Jannaschia pohangensis]|uniref:Amino acid/amide ABC transporter ATP-binding protein 2, HAAT family n=1 Tax=Jannaschia pohangensis TaxID=390807 RepID=A0A1I3H9B6_9RHOB|nr:ABC transporter permease [Jannaschia pohangensis]SFI32150.1 amino acid/amide ABC transporter ATP-binding protein 2, HAAT family [Jannaschia pohangensis]